MQPFLSVPSYVYLLFCALVYLGVKRCFPREASPSRMLLFPVAFAMLGVASLRALFPGVGPDAGMVALAALSVGAALGWLHARRWRLEFAVRPAGLLVRLPGDPSLLATLMLTFAAETYVHYAIASEQPWAATTGFALAAFAVWGLLVGMPLGRALNVVVRAMRYANGARDQDGTFTRDA
ncbi:DUF6622 family protein [Burkholderia ubonensis]|uniref:DUF6622 family protein n=1 Tax=Burkholderia ubonensis TaxID=101571 RepID=UPI0007596814|nr:DUF6622 family protein [Burkholderia ubonensis]AOI68562.1 hypothetical protein WI31_03115 [Burkholderia ubonensis]KUZ23085.1 hypothetical protein WI29_12865 [Burkholderia ubonensis]KUZ25785.1 hypothetical protein WI32_32515 [Burkholderia ubonensis]KUZ31761.1 hypothetical protein WI30_18140 [Burkholderia ubonensis]KUZ51017.1 hypothetical protein WI34_31025 [Burkholderia ubonensis]